MPITGNDLLAWGFQQGNWFPRAIALANQARSTGHADEMVRFVIASVRQNEVPVEISMRPSALPIVNFLGTETAEERANKKSIVRHMDALMRVPAITAAAVMPEAYVQNTHLGNSPKGFVIASTEIHPGLISPDICCSVAITIFKGKNDPKKLLDIVQAATCLGPAGRPKDCMMDPTVDIGAYAENPFLEGLEKFALAQFASQGDGEHFASVGILKSTGALCLVTHHGSRGLGSRLHRRGIDAALKHTALHAPTAPLEAAWLPANSPNGRLYWDALQKVRAWTKANHFMIHDLASQALDCQIEDRFWSEHNFIFQRSDGLFYHAKGATPSFRGFASDDRGLTLIPISRSEPILIARHRNRRGVLGFAPHSAGRILSNRTESKEAIAAELGALQAQGLDLRSYCGVPHSSGLPSAYKDAPAVVAKIAKHDITSIVDEVIPYGSLVAGNWRSLQRESQPQAA